MATLKRKRSESDNDYERDSKRLRTTAYGYQVEDDVDGDVVWYQQWYPVYNGPTTSPTTSPSPSPSPKCPLNEESSETESSESTDEDPEYVLLFSFVGDSPEMMMHEIVFETCMTEAKIKKSLTQLMDKIEKGFKTSRPTEVHDVQALKYNISASVNTRDTLKMLGEVTICVESYPLGSGFTKYLDKMCFAFPSRLPYKNAFGAVM